MSKDFNSAWLEAYERKQNNSRNSRPNDTRVQEQQAVNTGREHRPAKNLDAKENEAPHERSGKRYAIRVVFRVSDNRRRDAFGMLETVADCLVRAVRRFNQGDS